MAERLIERKDGTLDLVNHSEMNIGDEFNHSYNSIDKKQIYGVITEIIEQRKERRGIYVRCGIGGTPDAKRTEDAVIFYRPIYNVLPHLHKYQCCVQLNQVKWKFQLKTLKTLRLN